MHIHFGSLAAVDFRLNLQEIASAYQLIHGMYTEFCHIFPHFLSNKFHKVDDVLRFTAEILSQLRILGCYTYRAGIQIADTHHDTAHGDQRSCGKTKFLSTQHGSHHHITTAHQFTVCLDTYFVSQIVADQSLMGLCQTDFPGKSCIMDRTSRRGTGTSVITGDQDNLSTGLGYTGSYRTHTGF